jgi:hypothetical protein
MKKISENLKRIDKIRKIDTPWIFYLIMFIMLMIGAILVTYFTMSILRLKPATLIPLCVFFIIGLALAFSFITFLSIQEEEVRDCQLLTDLQNTIRSEQEAQLNLQRMSLQLREMNFGRDKKERDRCYLAKVNQLRA